MNIVFTFISIFFSLPFPVYWNLRDNIKILNNSYDLDKYLDALIDYLLILVIITIVFFILWFVFLFTNNKYILIFYTISTILICIFGFLTTSEMKSIKGDKEECIEGMEFFEIEHSLTRYALCQDNGVYLLYYLFYALLFFPIIFLLIKNIKLFSSESSNNQNNVEV